MRVDVERDRRLRVSERPLHSDDVAPRCDQVRREGVAQRMQRHRVREAGAFADAAPLLPRVVALEKMTNGRAE